MIPAIYCIRASWITSLRRHQKTFGGLVLQIFPDAGTTIALSFDISRRKVGPVIISSTPDRSSDWFHCQCLTGPTLIMELQLFAPKTSRRSQLVLTSFNARNILSLIVTKGSLGFPISKIWTTTSVYNVQYWCYNSDHVVSGVDINLIWVAWVPALAIDTGIRETSQKDNCSVTPRASPAQSISHQSSNVPQYLYGSIGGVRSLEGSIVRHEPLMQGATLSTLS